MGTSPLYRPTGPVLAFASTGPGDLRLPTWGPDDAEARAQHVHPWLTQIWKDPIFREAVSLVSTRSARRIEKGLDTAPSGNELRRAVETASTYLARWAHITDPFSTFAGVIEAHVSGSTAAVFGRGHQVTAYADASWINFVAESLERDRALLPGLQVVVNSDAVEVDGRVAPARHAHGAKQESAPLSRVVRAALNAAATPITLRALSAHVSMTFPAVDRALLDKQIDDLIDRRILIASLRPPVASQNTLAYLAGALREALGDALEEICAIGEQLDQVTALLDAGGGPLDVHAASEARERASVLMREIAPEHTGPCLAVDVRLDAAIDVSQDVLGEAAAAAVALLRVGGAPFGKPHWRRYHARFLARYGQGALVPVRDLTSDAGLGYPDGFTQLSPEPHRAHTTSERDALLLGLIQQATADGAQEIELTDAAIDALAPPDTPDTLLPGRMEIAFELHAVSTSAIDQGRFALWVTGAVPAGSSVAARYAHQLESEARARLAATFAPRENPDALPVQITSPLRHRDIAGTHALLDHRLALSQFPDQRVRGGIDLDELAVSADAMQLHLVHTPTGRRVAPLLAQTLESARTHRAPALARFLTGLAEASTAVYGPFDFGAAGLLPFTPRVRYRRTVLTPACWRLAEADLGPTSGAGAWAEALSAWRTRWRAPAELFLVSGGQRIAVDCNRAVDRDLIRRTLRKTGRLELLEIPPPRAYAWAGRPVQFLVPLARTEPRPRPLPPAAPQRRIVMPGAGATLRAEVGAAPVHVTAILTTHLPKLIASLRDVTASWHFARHRSVQSPDDQYIELVLHLTDAKHYPRAAAALSEFGHQLADANLTSRLHLTPYTQQPGQYGIGSAVQAAGRRLQHADSLAALAQIAATAKAGKPARAALTTASIIKIAEGFAADPASGLHTLVTQVQEATGPLESATHENPLAVGTLPDLTAMARITDAWEARDQELAALRAALALPYDPARILAYIPHDRDARAARRDPADILRYLMHDHYARVADPDPHTERTITRHTAAVARARLAALDSSTPESFAPERPADAAAPTSQELGREATGDRHEP